MTRDNFWMFEMCWTFVCIFLFLRFLWLLKLSHKHLNPHIYDLVLLNDCQFRRTDFSSRKYVTLKTFDHPKAPNMPKTIRFQRVWNLSKNSVKCYPRPPIGDRWRMLRLDPKIRLIYPKKPYIFWMYGIYVLELGPVEIDRLEEGLSGRLISSLRNQVHQGTGCEQFCESRFHESNMSAIRTTLNLVCFCIMIPYECHRRRFFKLI